MITLTQSVDKACRNVFGKRYDRMSEATKAEMRAEVQDIYRRQDRGRTVYDAALTYYRIFNVEG